MAYATDKIVKDKCGEMIFNECEAIQPAPLGPELLKYIHNVSFVGRQGTEVRLLSLLLLFVFHLIIFIILFI